MKRFVMAGLLILMGSPLFAQERSWEGTWNNRRFKTSGALKCVATEGEDGDWKATFSGEFQKQSFTYDVDFASKKEKKLLKLTGTAKVQGFEYEWTGLIKGNTLTGEYKGSNANYGSFELKESKKSKKKK